MEVLTTSRKFVPAFLAATAVATLLAVTFAAPRHATATPAYAAQTKLPCGQCHVSPGGGGALKPFGQKFKDNGHKL